jgi:hypothetical protein
MPDALDAGAISFRLLWMEDLPLANRWRAGSHGASPWARSSPVS